jgi:hypothetical protein
VRGRLPERVFGGIRQVFGIEQSRRRLLAVLHAGYVDLATATRLHVAHHDLDDGRDAVDLLDFLEAFRQEQLAIDISQVALDRQSRIDGDPGYNL